MDCTLIDVQCCLMLQTRFVTRVVFWKCDRSDKTIKLLFYFDTPPFTSEILLATIYPIGSVLLCGPS